LKNSRWVAILRFLSIILLFASAMLTVLLLVQYSRLRNTFPTGMTIGGVPVAGLDQQAAAERLTQAYGIPVELHYGDAVIQARPAALGFELDLESMIAAADLQRVNQPFWSAFWDYLWNRLPSNSTIPLRAKIAEERLRAYLVTEIAARYDQPATAALPVAETNSFQPGRPGSVLNIDRGVELIKDALFSPGARVVNLTLGQASSSRPSLQNLQIMLQQTVDLSGFDGVVEIYIQDLQTNQEIHFAYQQGQTIPPDVAFTAASTMKIPIMIATFRRLPEPTPEAMVKMIELMIERSENDPADRLMEVVMDRNLGPLMVTEDLKTMGYQNTFLAGYFYPGAALLQRISTPANQRLDINTGPDAYNQTTTSDMGNILYDLYLCSETGGGTFTAVFPGELSQAECRQMIDYLTKNRIGVLIQAGLPEQTRIANKHGWIIEYDGLLHTMGDAGIVYTPGGNYILVIFIHQPTQLIFEPANLLVAKLSRSIYNYFNFSAQ
jgi:beta-lactamase class A